VLKQFTVSQEDKHACFDVESPFNRDPINDTLEIVRDHKM
jgi:hypothetical protein